MIRKCDFMNNWWARYNHLTIKHITEGQPYPPRQEPLRSFERISFNKPFSGWDLPFHPLRSLPYNIAFKGNLRGGDSKNGSQRRWSQYTTMQSHPRKMGDQKVWHDKTILLHDFYSWRLKRYILVSREDCKWEIGVILGLLIRYKSRFMLIS